MSSQDKNTVYAAAQGREFLRDALEDKPNEWVREFAGLIDDPRVLDVLNYYCGVYEERHEDFLQTPVARQIVRDSATETVDRAYQSGNVSVLQGMVGLTSSHDDGEDALVRIARELTHEGTIAMVTGPPGSGKTATTLDVGRTWGALTGGRLIGNTGWDGFDEVVKSDVALLEAMASRSGQSLGIIDEAVQSLTGRGADSKRAETFADRMTLVRKKEKEHGPHAKRGSVLAVAHNWGRMNAPTRRMTTLIISKPSQSDPGRVVLWESPGGEDKREKIGEFRGLSDTRESYPEHEASAFDVLEDDDDDADAGPAPEEVQRRQAIKTVIRATKPWDDSEGATYGDAASLVDYSETWVGNTVREWRDDGMHRELVPDPRETA